MTTGCGIGVRCVAVVCQVQECCCSDEGQNAVDMLVLMFIALQGTARWAEAGVNQATTKATEAGVRAAKEEEAVTRS